MSSESIGGKKNDRSEMVGKEKIQDRRYMVKKKKTSTGTIGEKNKTERDIT